MAVGDVFFKSGEAWEELPTIAVELGTPTFVWGVTLSEFVPDLEDQPDADPPLIYLVHNVYWQELALHWTVTLPALPADAGGFVLASSVHTHTDGYHPDARGPSTSWIVDGTQRNDVGGVVYGTKRIAEGVLVPFPDGAAPPASAPREGYAVAVEEPNTIFQPPTIPVHYGDDDVIDQWYHGFCPAHDPPVFDINHPYHYRHPDWAVEFRERDPTDVPPGRGFAYYLFDTPPTGTFELVARPIPQVVARASELKLSVLTVPEKRVLVIPYRRVTRRFIAFV